MKQLILFGFLLTVSLCSNSFAQRKSQVMSYVDGEEYLRRNTIVSDNSIIKIEFFKKQSTDIATAGILFQIDTVIIKVTPFGIRQFQRVNTKEIILLPSTPSLSPYMEIHMKDYVDYCTNKIAITFNGINKYNINDSSVATIKYKSKKPYKFLKEGLAPDSCIKKDLETESKKPWWKTLFSRT